jgi:peroxiredoxin
LAQLRREYKRFEAAGLGIVAVGMGTPPRTKDFRASMGLPFPLLGDPRRQSYQRYGLLRMDFREVSAGNALRVARAIARYGGAASFDQDMAQLGGVFVVDTAGIVRYSHRAGQAHDNPAPDELLRAAAAMGGGGQA